MIVDNYEDTTIVLINEHCLTVSKNTVFQCLTLFPLCLPTFLLSQFS